MKHVVDMLTIGKRIPKEDYAKYNYISTEDWGNTIPKSLDAKKTYYAITLGRPINDNGEIRHLVAKNKLGLYERLSENISGQEAITHYKVIRNICPLKNLYLLELNIAFTYS